MERDDEAWLREALALAGRARTAGNHPFGALLVGADGERLGEAENTVVVGRDPTGHAELNLVRLTGALGPELLGAATLYSSTEPCAMCAGAIYWAGIGRVVYGLSEAELYTLTGAHNENPTMRLGCRVVLGSGPRTVAVEGPLLEFEARAVHAGFWH